MSQRWRTLQRVMLSPGKIGDITKAALVLVLFEHKTILKIAENLDEFAYVGVSDL